MTTPALISALESLLTRWQSRHDSSAPAHTGGHNALSDCMHELDDVLREAKRGEGVGGKVTRVLEHRSEL